MTELKANRVLNKDALTNAGDFAYTVCDGGKNAGIQFLCPCGCGENFYIPILGHRYSTGPCWAWDGDEDNPSLIPSILQRTPCRWHGYLTDGIWKGC